MQDIDGTALAVESEYNNQELAPAMGTFLQVRSCVIVTFWRLSSEDLERIGHLENAGQIDVFGLVELLAAHDREHIAALSTLKQTVQLARVLPPSRARIT